MWRRPRRRHFAASEQPRRSRRLVVGDVPRVDRADAPTGRDGVKQVYTFPADVEKRAIEDWRPGYRVIEMVDKRAPVARREIVRYWMDTVRNLPQSGLEFLARDGVIGEPLATAVAVDVNVYHTDVLVPIWGRAWKDAHVPTDERFEWWAAGRMDERIQVVRVERLRVMHDVVRLYKSLRLDAWTAFEISMLVRLTYWLSHAEAMAVVRGMDAWHRVRASVLEELDVRMTSPVELAFSKAWSYERAPDPRAALDEVTEEGDMTVPQRDFARQVRKLQYNRAYREGYRAADGESVAAFMAGRLDRHEREAMVWEGLANPEDVGLSDEDFYEIPDVDLSPSDVQRENLREFEVWRTDKGPNVCAYCAALEGTRVFPGEGFPVPAVGTGWALRFGKIRPGWHPHCHCDTEFEYEKYEVYTS